MKELLEKLRNLYETQILTKEEISNILNSSYNFSDRLEEFNDLISTDDLQITSYTMETGQKVTYLRGMGLYICTKEEFQNMVNDCAVEYVSERINDWLEPFFDMEAYYESCRKDKELIKLVLKYNDIENWEEVNNYVIMEY